MQEKEKIFAEFFFYLTHINRVTKKKENLGPITLVKNKHNYFGSVAFEIANIPLKFIVAGF